VLSAEEYEKLTEEDFNLKAQVFSKTIISNFQKSVNENIKTVSGYIESTLLNAIAQRYDPHSNYFTEAQNQDFQLQLSASLNSFGFFLDENEDGAVIISGIEPGGSAWLSNEVNIGDIFISFKTNAEKTASEDFSAYEIQDKLSKIKEDKILLTVKKQNGLLKTIKLIRQKVASTDNSVKGYLLSAAQLKIGYISLPSFYTDMEEHNKPGCANDVAKEILKLENDTIAGLILDLRNNGGGSVMEAMNLAGIFIDEGPLFVTKEKNKKPALVKDINRGSVFKKPLVVLINEASASASELFANILKDYKLGVVVGQTSYGKGSAQNIIPLDTNLLQPQNKEALKNNSDFIKITTSKFYRLNTSTHQGTGVSPDISLPATPGYSDLKENKEPFYLKPDSIVKKVVYNANPPINFQALADNSSKRISSSKDFNRFRQVSDSISEMIYKTQKVALKFKDFKKYKKETDQMYASAENSFETSATDIVCSNNKFDLQLEQVDNATMEFNARILQSLQKDIFINESFYIMRDLINQQKK
jgi:carboxyl-terminal processing protease